MSLRHGMEPYSARARAYRTPTAEAARTKPHLPPQVQPNPFPPAPSPPPRFLWRKPICRCLAKIPRFCQPLANSKFGPPQNLPMLGKISRFLPSIGKIRKSPRKPPFYRKRQPFHCKGREGVCGSIRKAAHSPAWRMSTSSGTCSPACRNDSSAASRCRASVTTSNASSAG